ncbi:NAD(P)-binding protein [Athelia psychrophila]|uniref:NAD(P)-binding protein n=1 Tax=Athelia psychrophila TaxID=1759441 RepID=A0A165WX17_9AGAM|nr:NAD(P)-binding protein [Fibularhizoctonia sp. CBS 109695]
MSQSKLSILVTGSNQGLGFSAARHLSKLPNVHLFVCGRDANRVQEAVEKLKREEECAAEIDTIVMDITDDSSIHAAVADLEKKLGGAALDVLVNNAGLALETDGDIERDGLRTRFENTFSVNAFGTAVAAEAFLPLLKRSTARPRIVNVGSSAGSCTQMAETRNAGWMVYKASKSALNSIAISLAVANPDVHVVVVDPGLNVTRLNTYGVGADPSEGSQIIVDYALEIKGNSPGFYSAQGVVTW